MAMAFNGGPKCSSHYKLQPSFWHQQHSPAAGGGNQPDFTSPPYHGPVIVTQARPATYSSLSTQLHGPAALKKGGGGQPHACFPVVCTTRTFQSSMGRRVHVLSWPVCSD